MSDRPMPVQILEWKPVNKNTLRGFAKIKLGAMRIHDVAIHTKGDRSWAQLPAKPQIGSDGAVRKNADGKILYVPLVEWDNRETSDRFSASVIAALEEANPGCTV